MFGLHTPPPFATVYTVGLYVNHTSAKPLLRKHKGSNKQAFIKNQQAYNGAQYRKKKTFPRTSPTHPDVVHADNVPKALRLVITYGGLKKSTFLDALDERLMEPVKQAGELPALQAFRAQFDSVELKKGSVFTFVTGRAGKLVTSVGDKQVQQVCLICYVLHVLTAPSLQIGTVSSPALVRALFDIYVGADAVSPSAKESFGRGLHVLANA